MSKNDDLQKLKEISLVSIDSFENDDFTKSNNFINSFYKKLDIYEIKIINSLLYVFSTYSRINKKNIDIQEMFQNVIYNDGFFIIKVQDLIKLTKTTKTLHTINYIDERLTKIADTNFKYLKENDLGELESISTRFIFKHKIIKKNNDIKQAIIKIQIDKELYEDIFSYTKVGYTALNINMNKLKSKIRLGLYEEIKRTTPLKQIRKSQNGNTDISTKSKKIHKYTLDEMNSICGTEFTFKAHIIRKLNIRYKQLLKLNLVENNYSFIKDKNYIYIDINRNTESGKLKNKKDFDISYLVKNEDIEF